MNCRRATAVNFPLTWPALVSTWAAEAHIAHTEETMAGKFEISKRSNGEYQFNLNAGNGQVILTLSLIHM